MRCMVNKSVVDELERSELSHVFEKEIGEMRKATWTQAGKHLEQRTDKHGHLIHKWIKNNKNKPVHENGKSVSVSESEKRISIAEEIKANTHAVGDFVLYKNEKGKQVNGEIVAVGNDGVQIKNPKGGENIKVLHSNVIRVLSKVNDNDEIRNIYDNMHIVAGFRNGEKGLQPESCDTVDGMWNAAETDRKNFSDYSESVKQKFSDISPILLKRKSLKGQDRAKEKLMADEMDNREKGIINEIVDTSGKEPVYHCRTLRDVDGHTFCCKTIDEVSKMLEYFNNDPKIIRIKNNFANPSEVGYSDINCNIRLENGTVAEIQLNTMANMVAKENYGHALYEVYRSVKDNPELKHVAIAMSNAQKKLYGLSNQYSKKGGFPDSITDPFGASFKPYNEAIRKDVRKALPSIKIAHSSGLISDDTFEHFEKLVSKLG